MEKQINREENLPRRHEYKVILEALKKALESGNLKT